MGVFFKTGKLGYIFIFGGRGENEELLSSCEQYSLEESKVVLISQKSGDKSLP